MFWEDNLKGLEKRLHKSLLTFPNLAKINSEENYRNISFVCNVLLKVYVKNPIPSLIQYNDLSLEQDYLFDQ